MNLRGCTGVVVITLAAACGGAGRGASEPAAGPSCATAAGPAANVAVDSMLASALDDASEAHVASARARMAANLTAACTDTAWTDAQRACFAEATTADALRACTGSFEARQTEAYGDAMLQALNAAETEATADAGSDAGSM